MTQSFSYQKIKDMFVNEYNEVTSLPIPKGYRFKVNGKKIEPNLMQKRIAYLVKTKRRIGNWSGTGTGKTLGAIYASRVIDSKITVIVGINNTMIHDNSGWHVEIDNAFENSNIIKNVKSITSSISQTKHNYILLNFEKFQLASSKKLVDQLLQLPIDMVVIDEVHSAKLRDNEEDSKRRELLKYLLQNAEQNNPDLAVLTMSATPVINNLKEGVSLLELTTGENYSELPTKNTVQNCLNIFKHFVINGVRYTKKENIQVSEHKPLILSTLEEANELRQASGSTLSLERLLVEYKLPEIIKACANRKTIVYTEYVDGIITMLHDALFDAGYKVGVYTGDDKTGFKNFVDGNIDVLVASKPISVGVDGLQKFCNNLVVACLPWTNAMWEQLVGRIVRQGSNFSTVDITVPIVEVYDTIKGEQWSWDKQRLDRIKFKQTIADAAVDGKLPTGILEESTSLLEKARTSLTDIINRINDGNVNVVDRAPLKVPLPAEQVIENKRKYGDFSMMNQKFNVSKSSTMNKVFLDNPEEWYQYHSLYQEARQTWTEIPVYKICKEFESYNDLIIGDFGCGERLLGKALTNNKVYSFDHVAIDEHVIPCDMSKVPIEDNTLDVAVFSLSLMSINWEDYLYEAYRVLKPFRGQLRIAETISRFDREELEKTLKTIGFIMIGEPLYSNNFVYLKAIKP